MLGTYQWESKRPPTHVEHDLLAKVVRRNATDCDECPPDAESVRRLELVHRVGPALSARGLTPKVTDPSSARLQRAAVPTSPIPPRRDDPDMSRREEGKGL